jgi:uncharacterized protein (DUF342 family)
MTYTDFQGHKYSVEISADHQRVTVYLPAGSLVEAKTVLQKLSELNVRQVDQASIAEQLSADRKTGLTIIAANGVLPRPEGPPELVLRVPATDLPSGTFTRVRKGQVLANISPPIPGTDGYDVFGQSIAHSRNTVAIEPGTNTAVVKGQIVAAIDGLLHVDHTTLSVTPVIEIDGNDPASAAIQQCDGDVFVRGNFPDGRQFTVSGGLVVGGAIEAVNLKVGQFVYVKGGVIGRGKGHYSLGHDLRCRFISSATVFAKGDVHVVSEVSNSKLSCFGRLHVTAGAIFGGSVAATGGVVSRIVGNSAGRPTLIEAGTDTPAVQLHAEVLARIEANRARILEARQKIQPLLTRVKNLTAAQKERATELLFEAEELEVATNKMEQGLARTFAHVAKAAKQEILVSEIAYPGVTIMFQGMCTTLRKAINGPCRFVANGRRQILLIDEARRTVIPLECERLDFPALAMLNTSLSLKASA